MNVNSVVRMEFRYPRPNINLDEYDGLLRIVFSRRNKTIAANFKTNTVMSMLEKNYKTFCSVRNIVSKKKKSKYQIYILFSIVIIINIFQILIIINRMFQWISM